jgi:hypothetical protein
VTEGSRIFTDEKEADDALLNGWETTPNKLNRVEEIKAKIVYFEEQLKSLKYELDELLIDDEKETIEFICDICGKVCYSKIGLNSHLRKHNKEVKEEVE